MKPQPTGTRLLVIPEKPKEETESGLLIPKQALEKPQRGIVAFAGPGTPDEPIEILVGMTVVYGVNSGRSITEDGHEYVIVKQSDVLYYLKDE